MSLRRIRDSLQIWALKTIAGNKTVVINATLQGAIKVDHKRGVFVVNTSWEPPPGAACDCVHLEVGPSE